MAPACVANAMDRPKEPARARRIPTPSRSARGIGALRDGLTALVERASAVGTGGAAPIRRGAESLEEPVSPFHLGDGRRVPALSASEMREVDRVTIESFGIQLVQMMENAGRSLAELAVELFSPGRVTVLAGPGGNGGGGLVAARHLHNRGVRVAVATSGPPTNPVTAHQARVAEALGVPFVDGLAGADLVLDALVGYGLRGPLGGRAAELVERANRGGAPVIALDVPSGLDATSGRGAEPCVRAAVTMTLALPKRGLARSPSVDRLFLSDISVLPAALRAVHAEVADLFARGPTVELGRDSFA
jgi:NAD(P)H-hydrate epimerase